MIRKHLRLKRLVLGLAVSFAIAVVSAPAVLAKPTSGNGPLDPWAYNVIHGGSQATVMPVVRYSAVSGPLGIAAYQSFAGTTPSAQHSVISHSGFDWGDAGIGALVAFGIALLLLTAVALGRRSRSRIGDRSGLATS
jgi:hypothetical protein